MFDFKNQIYLSLLLSDHFSDYYIFSYLPDLLLCL